MFGYLLNETHGFLRSYAGKEFGLLALKQNVAEKMEHGMQTGCILSWVVSDK